MPALREVKKLVGSIKRFAESVITGMPTCRIHGIRIKLDCSILPDNVISSLIGGTYELKEIRAMEHILRKGDCVLELGAGIGVISSVAARITSNGQTICVEANPALLPYITSLHKDNDIRAEVLNGVIARSDTTKSEFYIRDDLWSSSFSPTPTYSRAIQIKNYNVSDLIQQYQPDILIGDIEGGEVCLLDLTEFGSLRAIILEVHPHLIGKDKIDQLSEHISSKGFQLDRADKMIIAIRD
jgi:FkbM family methyltransferase